VKFLNSALNAKIINVLISIKLLFFIKKFIGNFDTFRNVSYFCVQTLQPSNSTC